MPRVTISEPDKTPQPYRFPLERKLINIGRGHDNDIVIDCGSVSTQHSVMERITGGYILRDNGSTNGIKQDGTLMEVIDLYDGIEILVGDIPFAFQLSEEEIDQLSKETYTPHQKKKVLQKKKLPDTKSDDDAPVRKPKPSDPPPPLRPAPMASAKPGMNPLLVILLMAAAVIGGMAIRHYKDHQKWLFIEPVTSTQEAPSTADEPTAE